MRKKERNYIIFKVKGSSFGQIINIKTRRRFVLVRIPRKYLTLTALKYIDDRFMFCNFTIMSYHPLQKIISYVSNGDIVNLAHYLEREYLSPPNETISWIYVK